MSNNAPVDYMSSIEIDSFLISYYRQGEKLGSRIYHHTDPLILKKIADKLHLTLVGVIESQQGDNWTEMRCTVAQWTSSPVGFGLTYEPLPKECSHDYVNVSFMGMKMECKHCGRAQ
jgi:hypothetical protein